MATDLIMCVIARLVMKWHSDNACKQFTMLMCGALGRKVDIGSWPSFSLF